MKADKWLIICIVLFLLYIIFHVLSPISEETQLSTSMQPPNTATYLGDPKYAIVFDLGSSGSRANVFTYNRNKFSHCAIANGGGFHNLRPMENGTLKIKPGVSELSATPNQIGESLSTLWTFLENIIPSKEHNRTPIFMFATAGLRVLAESANERLYDDDDNDDNVILESDDDDFSTGPVGKILNHLRGYIAKTPFQLLRDDHIRVLTGEEEALFDYLTVQQLLKLNPFAKLTGSKDIRSEYILDPPITRPVDLYPVCTVDLGGASTQIAFQTLDKATHNVPEFTKSPFKISYPKIFAKSFLNFGINRAREIYYEQLTDASITKDPCLFLGQSVRVVVSGTEREFVGSSSYNECKNNIKKLFTRFARDNPTVPDSMRVIAFDHAYRVLSALSPYSTPSLDILFDQVSDMMNQKWETIREYPQFDALTDNELNKIFFEGLYVLVLLSDGYNVPKTSVVGFADQIDGQSLSWALGALVHNLYQMCNRSSI